MTLLSNTTYFKERAHMNCRADVELKVDNSSPSIVAGAVASPIALKKVWSLLSKKKFPIETCQPILNRTMTALLGIDIAFALAKNIDDIDDNPDLLSSEVRGMMDLFDTGLKVVAGAAFLRILQKEIIVELFYMGMAGKPWGLGKAFGKTFARWVVAPLLLFGSASLASIYAKDQIEEASGEWITDLMINKSAKPVAFTSAVLNLPFDIHKHMPHLQSLQPNKTFQPMEDSAFGLIESDLKRLSSDIKNARTYGASCNKKKFEAELANIEEGLSKYEQLIREQALTYEHLLNPEGLKAYTTLYQRWSDCDEKTAKVAIGQAVYHAIQNRNTFERSLKPEALKFIETSRGKVQKLGRILRR